MGFSPYCVIYCQNVASNLFQQGLLRASLCYYPQSSAHKLPVELQSYSVLPKHQNVTTEETPMCKNSNRMSPKKHSRPSSYIWNLLRPIAWLVLSSMALYSLCSCEASLTVWWLLPLILHLSTVNVIADLMKLFHIQQKQQNKCQL